MQVRGFFGRKNPQHVFLRRGSKAVCPMSYFAACKRSLNVPWKSEIQAKFSAIFLAHVVPTSKRGGRQWQTTPKNLPCMQRSRSHISRLTGLWSLPDQPQWLILMNECSLPFSQQPATCPYPETD